MSTFVFPTTSGQDLNLYSYYPPQISVTGLFTVNVRLGVYVTTRFAGSRSVSTDNKLLEYFYLIKQHVRELTVLREIPVYDRLLLSHDIFTTV